MAITKIVTPELFDFSSLNTALQLPTGTTAERPGTLAGTLAPVAGEWRYNTTLSYVEYYDGTSPYDAAKWFQIDDEALPATCTTDTINYPTGTTNTAYYKMSDATDSTLNGYNGTATDVDFNVQGKFGNAGEFNGTSSKINTGYIQNGQVYSVSFWAKNLSANGSVLRDTPAAGGANTFMDIATGANGQVIIAGNAALDPLNTPSTDWINYVVVLDGTNATIFTNGSQTATITYTAKSGNNGTPVHIMSNGAYPVGFASGSIDQVRIFPTALTLGNVTSLHNEVQCVPAIIPSDYFNTVLYTGNGSTQAITGVGFQSDFTWIHTRNAAADHTLTDSVRGVSQLLSSNTTAAQSNQSPNGLTAFNLDGFTVQDTSSGGAGVNGASGGGNSGTPPDYVSWNWKAAATTTTIAANTVGNTIASDVRASTESGFSIVSYTGNSTTGATVGHGLSEVPEIIIVKRLQTPVDNWAVYNVTIGNSYRLALDDPAAKSGPNRLEWNNTTPTSTVFTLGNHSAVNQSSSYIAYCFASIPGMSDIGSYIGTNAPNNTIVTGFRPAYLMIKLTSAANGNWIIFDNKRNTSNPLTDVLKADDAGVETTEAALNIDFLSNGFTLNGAAGAGGTGQINSIGETYIYLAIAEQVYNANGVTANQTNPFNDGSQIAQYEFEDNADDSQPNGYIGKGGTFNGSSSVITSSSAGTAINVSSLSFSLWFKTNLNDSTDRILISSYDGSGNERFYASLLNSGLSVVIYGLSSPAYIQNFINTVTTGTWYHLLVTHTGTTTTVYLNGTAITPNTTSGSAVAIKTPLSPPPLTMGQLQGNIGTYAFNGSLDQVRLYDTALNPNDAWLLYSETSVTSSTLDYPASKGAIALYELEGNANDTGGTYNGADTAVAWVPLYDGTDGGTVTYAAPSVSASFLKAGDFNGTSSKIEITGLSTFLASSSSKSWSCWVKTTNTTAPNRAIISDYGSGGNYNFDCYMKTTGVVEIVSATGGSTVFAPSTKIVNDGEWHNIIAVQDTTANTLKLYIDSVEEVSLSIGTGTNGVRSLYIGTYGSGYFWNGQIDQARIFNKALDSGEILQLYNEPNN